MLINIAIRSFYEMFLEICICIMINITILDFSSASTSFSWITSFIFASGILASIIFLISLTRKNGPYYPGYYKKGTFWKSTWVVRRYHKDVRNLKELKRLKALRTEKEVELEKVKDTEPVIKEDKDCEIIVTVEAIDHVTRDDTGESTVHQERATKTN